MAYNLPVETANGTLTLIVQGVGGSSSGVRAVINWTEVR